MYLEHGDYTIYIDFSIEGETSLHRFETDNDGDEVAPMIIWEDGSNALTII